jgi:hypothetical protein
MSVTPRAPREAVAEEPREKAEIRDSYAALYSKGVQRLGDVQKRSIDVALQHNREAVELWKQMADKLPWAPRLKVFEQAVQNLERLAETQKTAIDLVVEQTGAFVDMLKERTAAFEKANDAILNFGQQSFDRTVAAQKKTAETTITGTKSAFENAREQFGFPGGDAVAARIQRGVGAVIDAQKELLETAR